MIITFDDDATIYMPTLATYGVAENWLSSFIAITIQIKRPVFHDLGRAKSISYNLGRSMHGYTLGRERR